MKINPWSFVCVCNFSFSRCNAGAKEQVHSSFSEGDQASVAVNQKKRILRCSLYIRSKQFHWYGRTKQQSSKWWRNIRRLERGHAYNRGESNEAKLGPAAAAATKTNQNMQLQAGQAPVSRRTFQISLGRLRVMRRTTSNYVWRKQTNGRRRGGLPWWEMMINLIICPAPHA